MAMIQRIQGVRPQHWVVGGLCLVGALVRALSVPDLVGDVDGVNLARGLERFDVFAQAPHFPGYPVLIAAARSARALGVDSAAWALALPGIVLFPLAGAVLFAGLSRRVGAWPAFGALAVAALSPGVVTSSGWPGSEGLGFALLIAAAGLFALERRSSDVASWVALGLLLGVRLSWWPVVLAFALLALAKWRTRVAPALIGGAAGTLAWLVPMLALFGLRPLLALAFGFADGHVHAWGGSALVPEAASLSARALRVVWSVWDAGLGAAWPGSAPGSSEHGESSLAALWLGALSVLGALSAIHSLAPRAPRRVAWLFALVAPYLFWLVGIQNVEKIRHVIPLLPLMGALIAAGLARVSIGRAAAVTWAVAMLAVALPRAQAQGSARTPSTALVRFVQLVHAPSRLLIFAGEEARVFEQHAPMYRVLRPADGRALEAEAERAAALGVDVWVTSAAPGFERVRDRLVPLHEFRFPHSVRPHESRLALARYRSDGARAALARAEGLP